MTERPSAVLDYGAFQQPPSALLRDYLSGGPKVAPFFGSRWDLEALRATADRTAAFSRHRETLADALLKQQESREAQGAARRAKELAGPHSVAIVTGQQAGVFGGPLYVLYKALAAIKVAGRLQELRGAPVVPVFWVASDDHDFAEVRSTTVLDEAGQLRTLRLSPRHEPLGRPASQIVLDEAAPALVQELTTCLPGSPHRDALVARLAECYQPGATLSGAFARFLSSLLPDLVVLDPSDPELKALMAPVLRREILEASPTSRLAAEVGARLLEAGYHQQVPVRPGFLNLFLMMDGERRALGSEGGSVEVRGLGKRIPQAEAVRLLESDPRAWSPGVLLRPLAQDLMLPTAGYVGGPAEIAYHAQIGSAYAHFGIPRPALVPRPSLTLVEPAQARVLEAEGLDLADLEGDPEAVVSRWAREAYPEVEGAFARARQALEQEMAVVEETLAALDPTLRAATDAARGRALHQIETLHEKSTRALKKRDQSRADRIRRTRDALFPGGSFQERGLGLVGPLSRHGLGLIEELRERMDPWAKGHQVIYL